MFFVGWFNFSFENSFEERDERPQRHKIWKQGEVVPIYLQKWLKLRISIHLYLLKKIKEKWVKF